MYTLRRVLPDGVQINTCLGSSYHLVIKRDSEKEFERASELFGIHKDDVFAFIFYNNGADLMPIYKRSDYYVMTEGGKTFNRITDTIR